LQTLDYHRFLQYLRNSPDEAILAAVAGKLVVVAFIVLGAWILIRLTRALADRIVRLVEVDDPDTVNDREKRARTLAGIFKGVSRIIILIIAALTVMQELGIPIGPLIAGVSVAGLAISFGAQNLVRDLISGFFILLEDQYKIGDVVRAAGVSGVVEDMNLRVTVLRDTDGAAHFIPNGEIKVVSNLAKEWGRAVVNIGVAYQEDINRILAILKITGEEFQKDSRYSGLLLEPPQVLGIENFDPMQISIRVLIKTRPLKQWEVGREYRRRVKEAFDQNGVQVVNPQAILYQEKPPSS
jgi:small conductance mechanosensitive channel